jgi:hypothetical protein
MSRPDGDPLHLDDDAATPLEHASKQALTAVQATRYRTGRCARSVRELRTRPETWGAGLASFAAPPGRSDLREPPSPTTSASGHARSPGGETF